MDALAHEIYVPQAQYREETIGPFRFNPLIEALPELIDLQKVVRCLTVDIEDYSEKDRTGPFERRMALTQAIAEFHQPMKWEIDIFERIDRCIRWGYADRNPLMAGHAAQLAGLCQAASCGGSFSYMKAYHPHAYGFSVLGVSGLGKTAAIEGILRHYPQVIEHVSYRGIPLVMKQIVWVKLDCSADGSLKGICQSFFTKLDSLLGTSYSDQYNSRRATLDQMMTGMAKLCTSYCVGLLIIDEIQMLCTAAKGVPEKVLNFLVTLVNTIGVPVITLGTPRALSIMQNEFQQAKRGSGQGDALLERMPEKGEWDVFCQSLWEYQYTRKKVELTNAMKHALYDEAQGIPFIAVHLYKLAQEAAILSGKETFSAEDLHSIASKKMRLTRPMRAAMKSGTEVDLKQFLDITPFAAADYRDNYSMAAEARNPVRDPKKAERHDDRAEAANTLMGMGLTHEQAEAYAFRVLAEQKGEKCSAPLLARKAFLMYMADENRAAAEDSKTQASPLEGVTDYDSACQKGVIDEIAGGIQA